MKPKSFPGVVLFLILVTVAAGVVACWGLEIWLADYSEHDRRLWEGGAVALICNVGLVLEGPLFRGLLREGALSLSLWIAYRFLFLPLALASGIAAVTVAVYWGLEIVFLNYTTHYTDHDRGLWEGCITASVSLAAYKLACRALSRADPEKTEEEPS